MSEQNITPVMFVSEFQQLGCPDLQPCLYKCRVSDLAPERLYAAIMSAGSGYLWMDDRLKTLLDLSAEETTLMPSFNESGEASHTLSPQHTIEQPVHMLSERDRQVLTMIASGATNRQIAHKLFLSISTIKLIIRRLLDTFQVADRTEAAVFATKHNLI